MQAQGPATKVHPPDGYYVRGVDRVDGRLLVVDSTANALRQSSDWGATWSGNKGLPSGVGITQVSKLVRFGNYIYLLATGSPSAGVWRAPPATGDTPYVWSPQLLALTRGATAIMTDLEVSTWGANDYLYSGDYGDPVGGPSMWRISLTDANGAGTTWDRIYGPDRHQRHIHAVAPDPYNRGQVWATLGDGGTRTVLRSLDYGATWSVVIADYHWQGVQISFDPRYVYIALDQPGFTYYVIDRATLQPHIASPNSHAELAIPPPAPPGARYYAIANFGAVDPTTGAYYCVANDTASSGSWMGMFFDRRVGMPVQVLDRGGPGINMNGEIFIAHGTVYSGTWQHLAVVS